MEIFKPYITYQQDYDFLKSYHDDDTLKDIIHYGILFVKKLKKKLGKENITSTINDEMDKLRLETKRNINDAITNVTNTLMINTEHCIENKLSKLDPNLDKIIKSIDQITKVSHNSNLLGAMGENIFENNFKIKYPNWEIINSAKKKTKDCADFIIKTNPPILIELKTYNNTIPTKEIDKFKRDLLNSNLLGGILMSSKTNISRKKMYDIDILPNNSIILYVPNAGINWEIGLDIIPLFINILKINRTDDITPILQDYTDELENIRNIIEKLSTLRKMYERMKNNIIMETNNLYLEIVNTELESKNIINRIVNKLQNQLDCDLSNIEFSDDEDKILQYVKNYNCLEFYNLIKNNNLHLLLGNDNLYIKKNNLIIGKIIKKRKIIYVEIKFDDKCLPINPKRMKIDKNNVLVNIDDDKLLEILNIL